MARLFALFFYKKTAAKEPRHSVLLVSNPPIAALPTAKTDGALSKNRTCDSSLPRTCFTTRLLGQFAKLLTDYTVRHKKIKEKRSTPVEKYGETGMWSFYSATLICPGISVSGRGFGAVAIPPNGICATRVHPSGNSNISRTILSITGL